MNQFFNDKAKAMQEMLRVAKPGTKILIADETGWTMWISNIRKIILVRIISKMLLLI